MVQAETVTGPQTRGDGSQQALRGDRTGAGVVTDAHGRYAEPSLRANTYFLGTRAQTSSAFIGAAGGTPLIGIMNPAGSGKTLAILQIRVACLVTAAVVGSFDYYIGQSALPTGTVTVPIQMASQQAAGSIAKGFINTAMTGSTAINYVGSSVSLGTSGAAAATVVNGVDDVAGAIIVAPGILFAVGIQNIEGASGVSVSVIWEEVPYP